MQVINNIANISAQQWEALLRASSTASWFQSKEAYDFYASLPDIFEPFVFAVECENRETGCKNTVSGNGIRESKTNLPLQGAGGLRCIVVGYITKEKSQLKHFFTRRAIIIGGPLLAPDATQEEVTTLMQALKAGLKTPPLGGWGATPIYIETRNFSSYEQYKDAFQQVGFDYKPHYDLHLDCTDRDQMFARMQDRKARKIKSLLAEGHEITEATTAQEVHDFYIQLKELYKTKVKTPLFPEAFFQTFVKNNVGKLLIVKHNNQITGGILCPILKTQINNTTPQQYNHSTIYEWFVVGDILSTWAAMDYANTHNITKADFMGAGEPNIPYGVRDFKLAMGGTLHEFGRFLHINNPFLYKIGEIGVKCLKQYGFLR